MEIGTDARSASAATTGSTRERSSSADTMSAPGRVDSPPTSMRSAPSRSRRSPASTATPGSIFGIGSANESGVTFRMPISRQRSPSRRTRPDGSGMLKERRRAKSTIRNLEFGIWNSEYEFQLPNSKFLILLFLRQRLVERRHDRRALLRPRTRFVFFGAHGPCGRRLRLLERQAGSKALDLLGVEHFARQEAFGDLQQRLFAAGEQLVGALVVVGNKALYFLVDLERRVLAVILVLRNLAAEEDLLLLLAERERAHGVAHAPLAHHLARQLGRALEIVAGAGGETVRRDL